MVGRTTRLRDGLDQFDPAPLHHGRLRKAPGLERPRPARHGNVRPVGPVLGGDAEVGEQGVLGIDQALQERLDLDLRGARQQPGNIGLREIADERGGHVPVATMHRLALDQLQERADDVAQAVSLPVVGPECEEDAFRTHVGSRPSMPSRPCITVCMRILSRLPSNRCR